MSLSRQTTFPPLYGENVVPTSCTELELKGRGVEQNAVTGLAGACKSRIVYRLSLFPNDLDHKVLSVGAVMDHT